MKKGFLLYAAAVAAVVIAGCEKKNTTEVEGSELQKPANVFPSNGAIDQDRYVTLSWTRGDTDVTDTVRYDVYLGTTDPPGANDLKVSGQTATNFAVSGLSINTTYYWLVVEHVGRDTAEDTVWHFSTQNLTFVAGMVFIPGGTFQMGSNSSSYEQPVHSVTVSSFYMDTTEVTQADYQSLMGVNPSAFTGDARRPVETVTWYDAVLYCNARSKSEGKDTVYSYNGTIDSTVVIDYMKKGYRLPTEAEWEYACKAGTTTDYYWGRTYPPLSDADTLAINNNAVWYHDSPDGTQPVAIKQPNAWGLHDMSGNVWEWCNDWDGWYSSGDQNNPTGPASGSCRMVRGGSWYYESLDWGLRSATRSPFAPVSWYDDFGFRCVRHS